MLPTLSILISVMALCVAVASYLFNVYVHIVSIVMYEQFRIHKIELRAQHVVDCVEKGKVEGVEHDVGCVKLRERRDAASDMVTSAREANEKMEEYANALKPSKNMIFQILTVFSIVYGVYRLKLTVDKVDALISDAESMLDKK